MLKKGRQLFYFQLLQMKNVHKNNKIKYKLLTKHK